MKGKIVVSVRAGLILAGLLLVAVSPAVIFKSSARASAPMPTAAYDLTGVWQADDGATYYVRQANQEIWWYGQSDKFANVFHGKMNSEGGFGGRWADVPVKKANSYGNLNLKIVSSDQFVQTGPPANFHAKVWNRVGGSGDATGGEEGSKGGDVGAATPPGKDMGAVGWDKSVLDFDGMRDKDGQLFTFTCPAGGKPYGVFGSNPYDATYSSICTSAVHAGVVDFSGGQVTIRIGPGNGAQPARKLPGSQKNGVKSNDDPSTLYTFTVLK